LEKIILNYFFGHGSYQSQLPFAMSFPGGQQRQLLFAVRIPADEESFVFAATA
jgi:hypothetical protein